MKYFIFFLAVLVFGGVLAVPATTHASYIQHRYGPVANTNYYGNNYSYSSSRNYGFSYSYQSYPRSYSNSAYYSYNSYNSYPIYSYNYTNEPRYSYPDYQSPHVEFY